MPAPFLLIVTGLPCTGKSSIAERLSIDLGLPQITKDGIKEQLFTTLGWKDRDWSRKLSQVSVELLLYFAETQLAAGSSLIIESNFQAELAVPRLLEMKTHYKAVLFQLYCRAEADILYERFKARTGTRHPGHADQQYLEEFPVMLEQTSQTPLDLDCPTAVVDTSDLDKVDYPALLKAVRDVQSAAQNQRE